QNVSLNTQTVDGIEYVSFHSLNQVFKSIIKEDREENRVYFNILGEQIIFLINTSLYTYKQTNYNMIYPLRRIDDGFYVPAVFVTEHLPARFNAGKQVSLVGGKLQFTNPRDSSIRTIVIDPGHGGKDPGAVGRKLKTLEKDINLEVAIKIKTLLENELGLKIILTRSDDRFISLSERTKYANDNKADLFVSIHTNASQNTTSHGIETYYLATATTSEARAVEALENQVVELYEGGREAVQRYDDLAFILSDILQSEYLEASNTLATQIQQNLVFGTKALDRGVHQANFYVLRGAFMPAVLIELGFLSNANEEKLLLNAEYKDRLARTIFEGIKRFKYRYDRIRNT
ncbi:MAG: N-acetylmuramoyl-L-alanine amidase, partial [Candidatus Cloacimonetes bacterium]|nr:N-acetylmuramoyl-L-alanine amidase [Candidatus Cloacimonadota bacterium]